MIGFLKALGSGVLAIGGAVVTLGVGVASLWDVGTGEIEGWWAIGAVVIGVVFVLAGVGFVAMVGDAMDNWDGGR